MSNCQLSPTELSWLSAHESGTTYRVAQKLNKRAYDVAVKPASFQPGDMVWYFCPRARLGTSPKWTRFYRGPYQVIKRINDINYVIRATAKSRPIVVHVNKLRACREFTLQ